MKKKKNLAKFRVTKMGVFWNGAAKILNFSTINGTCIEFSEWVDIRNKLNLTKHDKSPPGWAF